jgi:Domain of unknown function (DUF4845)
MHTPSTHKSIRRQRGVTALGWLFLLIPVAMVVYAGIRLTPIYLNYMSVARSLEQTASSFENGSTVNQTLIFVSLSKHFDVQSIQFPSVKDVTIQRDGTDWVIEAKYQDVAPLFGNVSLLLDFDKVAHIRMEGG